MFLNLNVIHTRCNWLCWKAQEKFQVEFRFCKTIGCSYLTLLTTYLAPPKKTIFKVSNRNRKRKRCLLKTLKTSERCHLTTNYLTEVTAQNHIFDSLQCQFAICLSAFSSAFNLPVCLQLCFRGSVISTIADSYMSLYEKWQIITELFDSWKIRNVSIFHFWKNSPQNGSFYLQRATISVSQN